MWDEYVWIVVLGAFMAFFTAYGIGANDVANAFATSVGSKALTITQAVIIAAIFEFLGAVLVGSQVTDTVRKKIADVSAFKDDPEVLMYGMLCVLFATGLWLMLASYAELPVSTTHSVIGGIIGMAVTAKGTGAVVWWDYNEDKDFLKKFSGVVPVVVSWVVSPVLAGIFAVILFGFVRAFVLRSRNSFDRALIFMPFLVGITVAVNAYFIIYKGYSRKVDGKKLHEHLGAGYSSLIAWGVGMVVGLGIHFLFVPWLRVHCPKVISERAQEKIAESKEGYQATSQKKTALTFLDRDVHSSIETNEAVKEVHGEAEQFDETTEVAFCYLQVFTAICDSFAHGANDVANSIGPFAAIYSIYKDESSGKSADVPEWILALGGFGLVVGLATYGYNIIEAIGVKLIKVSASRGFSIELGSACVIILGSKFGIPLSTTHCQVGATVGVGLLEGRSGGGVNGWLFMKVISGWLLTLLVVGLTTAGVFAQGIYAPSIPNLNEITRYHTGISETISTMVTEVSSLDATAITEEANELLTKSIDISKPLVELLQTTTEQAFSN